MDESSVGDEWNSGEELTVTLIDQDLNKNTLVDEDLVMANTTAGHLVPSLQIGSPLMVNTEDGSVVANSTYSNIAWYDSGTTSAGAGKLGTTAQNFTINTGYDGTDMGAIDTTNTYFNWDFSSFNGTWDESSTSTDHTVFQVCLVNGTVTAMTDVICGDLYENKGIKRIPYPANQSGQMNVNVTMTVASTIPTKAFVADVFSFGTGVNNAIYRILLEETDVNTATFEGTVEYTMLNQLNIDARCNLYNP